MDKRRRLRYHNSKEYKYLCALQKVQEVKSTDSFPRQYGFICADKANDGNGTLARSRKDSFYWYKKVIASDGEDLA